MEASTRPVRRFIDAHLGSRDVARVIYGAIVGLAVVVALEIHPPSAGATAATVIVTAVAIGLAEIYSEAVAAEARTGRRIYLRQIRGLAGEAVAVAFGAGFPALFFIAATLGLLDVELAFTLSKWTGLGLICGYGFLGARLSGAGLARAAAEALAVGTIGALLIALKALVH